MREAQLAASEAAYSFCNSMAYPEPEALNIPEMLAFSPCANGEQLRLHSSPLHEPPSMRISPLEDLITKEEPQELQHGFSCEQTISVHRTGPGSGAASIATIFPSYFPGFARSCSAVKGGGEEHPAKRRRKKRRMTPGALMLLSLRGGLYIDYAHVWQSVPLP